jgi:hypothetical protein
MKDRRIAWLVLSCVAYLALMLIVPQIGVPRHIPGTLLIALLVVITAAFMFAQIGITRWFASLTPKPLWVLAIMTVSVAAWAGVVAHSTASYARYYVKDYGSVPVLVKPGPRPQKTEVTLHRYTRNKQGRVKVEPVKSTGELRPSTLGFRMLVFDRKAGHMRPLTNMLMIFAASAFGYLVSLILRHPNIVLPVGGLAAYIDVWVVLVGPTAKALEKVPHVVSAVSVSLPEASSAQTGFSSLATIGPADFIFLGMFFGALYRLKMNPVLTFWLMVPILTLGILSVISGWPPMGLPALVLMGPVVIIANYKHFKLTRDEYIAIGIVGVILALLTVILTRAMGA